VIEIVTRFMEISEREPGDLGGFYEGPTDLANVYTSCYNLTMIRLPEPLTFAWDDGNQGKNALKHQVSNAEAEEAFFDPDKRSYPDPGHSHSEIRRILVGKTGRGRILLIVYTIRQDRIRVISARDLNKKREVDLYEEAP